MSDELPPLSLCASAYSITFNTEGKLLMTDLLEGERPVRILDIPGGHIDPGETPEEAVVRETFEETGVRVKVLRQVAYKENTINAPEPPGWRYPYPTGYMIFYLCEVVEETPFSGNEDAHGRAWLHPEEFGKSKWCMENRQLLEEILTRRRVTV